MSLASASITAPGSAACSVSIARLVPTPQKVGTCTALTATRSCSPSTRCSVAAAMASKVVAPPALASPTAGTQSNATGCGKTVGSGGSRWLKSAIVSPLSASIPSRPPPAFPRPVISSNE